MNDKWFNWKSRDFAEYSVDQVVLSLVIWEKWVRDIGSPGTPRNSPKSAANTTWQTAVSTGHSFCQYRLYINIHSVIFGNTGMCPVGVMDGSEVHVIAVTHQRGHHHMRTVQWMNLHITHSIRWKYKVGRECGALPSRHDRKHIAISHIVLRIAYLFTLTWTSCMAVEMW